MTEANEPRSQPAGVYHKRVGKSVVTAINHGAIATSTKVLVGTPHDEAAAPHDEAAALVSARRYPLVNTDGYLMIIKARGPRRRNA